MHVFGCVQKVCTSHTMKKSVHLTNSLYFFGILFLLVIIVVFIFVLFFLVLCFLRVVLFLLLTLLHFAKLLPLLNEDVCLGHIVGDNDVVKDCPAFHLPQIKPNEAEIIIFVQGLIVHILWIGDHLGLPNALVCRVGYAFGNPCALVFWIVLHRGLPLSILLIVPIVWLFSLTVHNSFLFHPIIWLLRLWVIYHRIILPII